jgi:hypothetical protein
MSRENKQWIWIGADKIFAKLIDELYHEVFLVDQRAMIRMHRYSIQKANAQMLSSTPASGVATSKRAQRPG